MHVRVQARNDVASPRTYGTIGEDVDYVPFFSFLLLSTATPRQSPLPCPLQFRRTWKAFGSRAEMVFGRAQRRIRVQGFFRGVQRQWRLTRKMAKTTLDHARRPGRRRSVRQQQQSCAQGDQRDGTRRRRVQMPSRLSRFAHPELSDNPASDR